MNFSKRYQKNNYVNPMFSMNYVVQKPLKK